jgi:CheY-like chemotaxis protein
MKAVFRRRRRVVPWTEAVAFVYFQFAIIHPILGLCVIINTIINPVGPLAVVPDGNTMTFRDARTFDQNYSKGLPILLLAEDDVLLRNLVLVALKNSPFAVLVAVDGQEALELSRSFDGEIALLVTDMEMPRMGGSELAELLIRERSGIRILQMSGELAENFSDGNLSAGFLQKPFGPKVLEQKILEVMAAPAGSRQSISAPMV